MTNHSFYRDDVAPVVPAVEHSFADKKRKRIMGTEPTPATSSVIPKVQEQLAKWTQRHQEFIEEESNAGTDTFGIIKRPKTVSSVNMEFVPAQELPEDEYSDTVSFICLLCQRKLASLEVLRKHAKLSKLHLGNLADQDLVRAGKERKRLWLEKQTKPVYRDRAAEMRSSHQYQAPPELSARHVQMRAAYEQALELKASLATESAHNGKTAAHIEAPISSDNIGSKLLRKMGWKEGEGLGREGSGRVEPLKPDMHARQAGIGVAGAKDVAVRDAQLPSTATFADKVRDSFRRRYEAQQQAEQSQ